MFSQVYSGFISHWRTTVELGLSLPAGKMGEPNSRLKEMLDKHLKADLKSQETLADWWIEGTSTIHVDHLFCKCGISFLRKIENQLQRSSISMVKDFMTHFLTVVPSESTVKDIVAEAADRRVHCAVIFFEKIKNISPPVTLGHVIQCLKMAHLHRVIANLPKVTALLRHATEHGELACCNRTPEGLVPRLSCGPSNNFTALKASRGTILITFVEDGRNHAMEVKKVLEESKDRKGRTYVVYMLSNFAAQLKEDTPYRVEWLLTLVDFVVPILTDGYMHSIRTPSANPLSIDERYAPLVAHSLLSKCAIELQNKQLRGYRPKDSSWREAPFHDFHTFVTEPDRLPEILIKSKYAVHAQH